MLNIALKKIKKCYFNLPSFISNLLDVDSIMHFTSIKCFLNKIISKQRNIEYYYKNTKSLKIDK